VRKVKTFPQGKNKMKITKSQLKKVIKEAVKTSLKIKKDPEAYRGEAELRGGVKVRSFLPSVGDVVVFHEVDWKTDTRKYYYGKVVDIEKMRGNRASWNTKGLDPDATVEVHFVSGQAKKGSKTGEQNPLDRLPAPQLFSKKSSELNVLADQSWLDKQS
jgi:hypothetical protein